MSMFGRRQTNLSGQDASAPEKIVISSAPSEGFTTWEDRQCRGALHGMGLPVQAGAPQTAAVKARRDATQTARETAGKRRRNGGETAVKRRWNYGTIIDPHNAGNELGHCSFGDAHLARSGDTANARPKPVTARSAVEKSW